ncbi:hypothetical protein B0H13DRAFT_2545053 [Mycena leptocephala]|nr:hypothetical protein B0H13DRAFT_2545053 [Mycena leptocephala]
MQNCSPPGSPDPSPVCLQLTVIETFLIESKASELVTLADSILRDCMAESSLANLNTAIYLLAQVWLDHSTQNSQCLNLLSIGLLTRFSYSCQWRDVQIAGEICMFLTGLKSERAMLEDCLSNLLNLRPQELQLHLWQMDENSADIVTLAGNILTDFHQSINSSSLDTAIVLYKEALSAQDSLDTDWDTLRTLRQVANAHLIHFRATGDGEDVHEAISLLRRLHMAYPSQVSCLCAALLSEVKITHVFEANDLIRESSKSDEDVVELGRSGAEFLIVFQQAGHDLNLDVAISKLERAATVVTWGHKHQASIIGNLGTALHARAKTRGDPEDLSRAIRLWHEVLDLHPVLHPDRCIALNNLATGLHQQFVTRGDPTDLDSAIELYTEALDVCPSPHTHRRMFLNNVGVVLYRRFQRRGDVGDLDSAIGLHQEALGLFPAPDPERSNALNSLASVLHARFQTRGHLEDLDNAIVLNHEALDLRPAPHPDRGRSLSNLANVLYDRFRKRGDAQDLDNVIVLHQGALELYPAPHPDRGNSLSNLATVLYERFQARGDPVDLNSAIGLCGEALTLCPASHPDRDLVLNNLANVLHRRFETRGDAGDLDNAIVMHYAALDLRPAPHPKRGSSLNNLADELLERFETRGDAQDLDNAIVLHHEALDARPAPHPDRSSSLNNLANAFRKRFQTRGNLADLENGLALHRESLDLCPAGHPDRDKTLNNLATMLFERFQIRDDIGDLENSIGLFRERLDLRPAPHPDRSTSLSNLAAALHCRFQTRDNIKDLDNAIVLHQDALELRPAPHPERDLGNAISLQHEALDLCPASHPERGSSLNNLAAMLHDRFRTIGNTADVDNAVKLYSEALDLHRDPHPGRGTSLMYFAQTMITKYDSCLEPTILHDAVVSFREGSAYLVSPIPLRCETSAAWARAADKRNHDSALEAYETFIGLLPQQAMLGLDIHSRQKALTLSSNIGQVSEAAACAIQNNVIDKAIEFLEAGRSVFWSQALQLHTPLDDLHSAHPELAARLSDISKQLELGSHRAGGSIRALPAVHKDHMVLDKEDAHYRKLNAQWIKALNEVRQQPGFERFLRPKLMNELRASAIHGPIVILNASRYACTAFIITLSEDVHCVNLENVTRGRAQLLVDLLRALLSRSSAQIIQTLTKIPDYLMVMWKTRRTSTPTKYLDGCWGSFGP